MDEDFVKATVLRATGIGFAEVPLAKDASAVAGGFEVFGERWHVGLEQAAATDGVGDADLEFVLASHQGSAGRGAGRGCEEVFQAHALVRKGIEVRGFQRGIAIKPEVGQPLVISKDDEDVWLQ